MTNTSGRRGPGRPREYRLGEDLAVACALERTGTTTSLADLSDLLQIDEKRIQEIIAGLEEGTGPEGTDPGYLATFEHEDGTLDILDNGQRPASRKLRLTPSQAVACCEALDRLGVPREDGERIEIENQLYPAGFEMPKEVQKATLSETELKFLCDCALSIVGAEPGSTKDLVRQVCVEFKYGGENDTELGPRKRWAVPLSINFDGNEWTIDAYDTSARDIRTYFLSRISNLILVDKKDEAVISKPLWDNGRYVDVSCALDDDDTFHALLSLDGAAYKEGDDSTRVVRAPYDRNDWLPRQLLALHGKIEISGEGDVYEELVAEMRDVAKRDLAEAKKIRLRKASAADK